LVQFFSEFASSTGDVSTWSSPLIVARPNEHVCGVGASVSEIAMTWLDASLSGNPPSESLYFRTSPDGITWTPPLNQGGAILAKSPAPLDPLYGSTTNAVLSQAFASVLDSHDKLDAVGQFRSTTGVSNVFLRTLDPISKALTLIGDSTVDSFLPGTGECRRIVGLYQATVPGPTTENSPFRYTVWSIEGLAGPSGPIFISGSDLFGQNGISDKGFTGFRRIGEYTSVDCGGSAGWAAWTDLRHGKAEIFGAQIPLPINP